MTGETLNYGYDKLNRLSGVSGTWAQTYTYDGFGNLTGKSAVGAYPAMNASFDPLTNRQNGLSYDANGNVTANGAGYDVENRLAGDSTALYVYDHAGKRVEKRYQATEEYYFYGIGGQKLVTQVCQTTESGWGCGDRKYNVYFGGKLVASKGVVVVTDRLGSVRANSAGERMSYYPYGEEKTTTADGREKFGTYTRDSATQDYADQRYYAVGMGRFNSADPAIGESPTSPAAWNRYAYANGDPIGLFDPNGTNAMIPGYCSAEFQTCDDREDYLSGGGGGGGRGKNDCNAWTGSGYVPIPSPVCYVPPPLPALPAETTRTCTLELRYRPVNSIVGPVASHLYLEFKVDGMPFPLFYEGFSSEDPFNTLGGPTLKAQSTFAPLAADNPKTDSIAGAISGSEVCDFQDILERSVKAINRSRISYSNFGPNSNSAAHYILDQLPVRSWYSVPFTAWGWGTSLSIVGGI